ncbi:recombinase RecQ [Nocardia sp. 852002-20019_SCH5090214]|uniref:RecQ family ATP-dependent DNA helicase n=1 Tax=Nocardia TaxID=1817 RepID=UPI0007E9B323|nr:MULTISPECIES: ATP-dependent DNA helicase RecQ [Nocardia]OBF84591.1 recombinase RecQ [Mycobacterium sp. 852002-51759_SCH5129042]MBF6273528.1 ATP-dependent DNA helicase RecQ [Nocardia nova]OBA44415.1 recombinase RecQ [Nocardia sp. 852002-51101_SCH5132738]OBA52684.1 recombinase RecQ [Nocardia sp. 852002-20019_SCH5090214]OBB47846.1 recombinase RecQ [Nocardia sp. 852002-51244_SCH5132740]
MERVTTTELRESAESLLRELAGPEARLREDQWTAIEALVVQRRRALVVQRTGWGKSAVYFIAARLLRSQGRGPTVIVSPLLALMRNQVAAARRAGVIAETINSGNVTEWDEIHQRVAAGEVDVLLVSPERLNNPDFRDSVLPKLAADAGLVVVDEAHCISDWGHDFRPDYRRIRTLIADLGEDIPVLATTATANDRVVTDVATQIGTDTLVLRGTLDRESLHLSVVRIDDAVQRTTWLSRQLGELPGSGIIYTLTVAAAHDLADVLADHGYPVAAYTGRTEPGERETLEQALLDNDVKALVATSALGMGFDKPDLGFVVHVGAPSSPIAYYQQVGRAGRGLVASGSGPSNRAEVILLPGPEDRRIWNYFASVAFPREQVVRSVLAALDYERPLSTVALEPLVELSRSRLEMVLKVLDVDGAVRRVRGGWLATGQPWTYDTERYERLDRAREAEQNAMLEYQSTTECRMNFLRRQLDDPGLAPDAPGCGRCDNCTGRRFDVSVDAAEVATIRARLDRPGIDLLPRKQWPTGLSKLGVPLSGKISDGPEVGRVLGRLSDLGWGQRLRTLLDAPDGPAPDHIVDACIAVLREWNWTQRPGAVMALQSATHPALAADLAARLARIGRLTDLGVLHTRPDRPPVSAANSAHRVAALFDSWETPDLTGLDTPVLLVDTHTDTGWTLTLAARTLRHAGAPAVLPFALATPT